MKKLTKKQQQYALAAALVALAGVTYLATRGPKLKAIYDPDDDIVAVQGHPFTVRMPRGTYSVASPDLFIQAQNSVGTETQVVLVAPAAQSTEYKILTVLVDETTGKPFAITVIARPFDYANSNPNGLRGDRHMGVALVDGASTLLGGQA